MKPSNPAKKAEQTVADADKVKNALALLNTAIADPTYVDSFFMHGREGMRLLVEKAPVHASVVIADYLARVVSHLKQPAQRKTAGQAAKELAWDIFWKGIMGYKQAPPLSKQQQQPQPQQTHHLSRIAQYLGQLLDIAIQRSYMLLKSGPVQAKTEFSAVPEVAVVEDFVARQGGVSKAWWLDQLIIKHAGEVEHFPISEVSWRLLGELADRQWLEASSASIPTGESRWRFLMRYAAPHSKIYQYILKRHGYLLPAERAVETAKKAAKRVLKV